MDPENSNRLIYGMPPVNHNSVLVNHKQKHLCRQAIFVSLKWSFNPVHYNMFAYISKQGGRTQNKGNFLVTSLNNGFENILVANLRPTVFSTCSPFSSWLARPPLIALCCLHSFVHSLPLPIFHLWWSLGGGDDSVSDWSHFKLGIVSLENVCNLGWYMPSGSPITSTTHIRPLS